MGDVVRIRVFNDPESFHPIHHPIPVLGRPFLMIERDGIQATNRVWKDTDILPVGSTMDLLVEMSHPGPWMLHCHIAEHLHAQARFVCEGRSQRRSAAGVVMHGVCNHRSPDSAVRGTDGDVARESEENAREVLSAYERGIHEQGDKRQRHRHL